MKTRKGSYEEVIEGEWISPIHRGHKLACCDCHLVHIIDFRIVPWGKRGKLAIEYRVKRHERATAAMRRPLKFTKDED